MTNVSFNYCQTGFNAHRASTKFTFDEEVNAHAFIRSIWGRPGYSEITLNEVLVVDDNPILVQTGTAN